MKSRGLGKGLNALISENVMEIPQNETKNEEKTGVIKLNINDVEPNIKQPRKMFDEDKLEELTESIRQFGVIQPLLVKKQDGYYEIIAGERRWRAAKKAGLKDIPVIVTDYNTQEILEVSLIENIQREDLNPIEEAQAFKRLIDEFSLKQEDVAKKLAKSRSSITNTLRLLNLDERVQQLIVQGTISSGHARALITIEDKSKQYELALKIIDEELSVRQVEKIVKLIKEKKEKIKKENTDDLAPIFKELEDRLISVLGTKVNIVNRGKKGGKLEIEYFSNDDLERIIYLIESGR